MPRLKPIGLTNRVRMLDDIRGKIKYGMERNHIGSQKRLAEKAKIDPSTLSRHLNDLEKMTLKELLSICDQTGLEFSIRSKGYDI
jgi:hypothetical protein